MFLSWKPDRTAPPLCFGRLLAANSLEPLQCFECLLIFTTIPSAAQALIAKAALSHLSLTACIYSMHGVPFCCWSSAVLSDLTPSCLCPVRFDYCRFIELDYVPMEAGYMVSMRPTKGYTSTKSPTKGYNSTKSPDRQSRSTNSPSTPRSRFVLNPVSLHVNENLRPVVNIITLWKPSREECFHNYFWLFFLFLWATPLFLEMHAASFLFVCFGLFKKSQCSKDYSLIMYFCVKWACWWIKTVVFVIHIYKDLLGCCFFFFKSS